MKYNQEAREKIAECYLERTYKELAIDYLKNHLKMCAKMGDTDENLAFYRRQIRRLQARLRDWYVDFPDIDEHARKAFK